MDIIPVKRQKWMYGKVREGKLFGLALLKGNACLWHNIPLFCCWLFNVLVHNKILNSYTQLDIGAEV